MDKLNNPRVELYELTGAYADIAAQLMACETDEEYDAALNAFGSVETAMADEAAQLARIMRNLQLRAAEHKTREEYFKAEGKRHEQKRKSAESAIERIRERVMFAMETAGMERIRTDIGTWYTSPSMSCKVIDAAKVPAEFVKGYTPEIDKDAAKKHFAFTGEIIDGLEITQTRTARFR